MSDEVSLKEHLEQRFGSLEKALQIQTDELERRLTELNHAHERAERAFHEYLPRNEYNLGVQELTAWRTGLDAWRNRFIGTMLAISALSAALGGVISAMIGRSFGFWK